MITFTLVAIFGILLVIVLMQLFKTTPPAAPAAPPEDLANLKVTDARVGDALSIAGAGDRMTDLDFTVERGTRYEAGSRNWVELTGPYQERRVALHVGTNRDEEVEVYLHSKPGRITLEDLGLSEDDLAQIDERQNPADNFEYDSTMWQYELSREVRGWRDNQQQPVAFYYWEFRTQDGRRLMGLRKSEGEPFSATEYVAVSPADVTVYRGK
jgi:hypothetical protein